MSTWTYNGTVPGPLIRARRGDTLEITVRNQLPEHTTVHWHGLALRNDMDGIHHVTQAPIETGQEFVYRFALGQTGTYWYHSHIGLQADRGMYAPLVIDDPSTDRTVDGEHVIVLDDWLDGIGGATPADAMQQLHCDGSCTSPPGPTGTTVGPTGTGPSMIGRFHSPLLGGDAGSIDYPLHLLNGQPATAPPTFDAAPGSRVRLRVINAGAETAYRFAVGGHRLTVTHADGYPVEPVDVDALLLGMGERYDVEIVAKSGAWPIVANAEGKRGGATGVLRTTDTNIATTAPPTRDAAPSELDGKLLTYDQLRAIEAVRLDFTQPDQSHEVGLTGRNADYHWGIDGGEYPNNGAIDVRLDERARIAVRNTTKMWHPMHLHGHSFRLGERADGPRKDTAIVKPGELLTFDTVCDNPGQWMVHCHNAYHLEMGMAKAFGYVR